MQRRSGNHTKKKRWIKYAVGAVLILGICVFYGGGGFSNDLSRIVQSGLIIGPFLFLFIGPAHFILQLLTRWLITRLWQPRMIVEGLIENLPALVIFILCFVAAAAPWPPSRMRKALQLHFDSPLPASVQVTKYRMERGMNDGTYAFALRINPEDLNQFLTNSGCWLVDLDLDEAQLVVLRHGNLTPAVGGISQPCAIYRSETKHGITQYTKTLLVDSNRADLLF